MNTNFNTIEEALEELRKGKMIVVVDDPDRENEGDLICAAEHASLENVNFMASFGKGLICMPMSKALLLRSEERRVGKECRSRWSPYH